MSRPRQLTDEQILAAARACFLAQGAGASAQQIAERLGVSHAVLFQRFKTKDQLLRAALTPPARPEWVEKLKDGPDERPVQAQLLELATALHAFMEQVIPPIALLRSTGVLPYAENDKPEDRPPVRARRELAAWFKRLAKAQGTRFKADHAADLLLGAMQSRPFHRHVSGRAANRADDRAFIHFAVTALMAVMQQPAARRTRTHGGAT